MKKLTFQVEKWSECEKDMQWLYPMHWSEVASGAHGIPLKLNYEMYDFLEKDNQLLVVTARDDDKIVGYHVMFINYHIRYKDSLTATSDAYFLHQNYRKGFNGYNLFKFTLKILKELGVYRMITQTKVSLNRGAIFKRLGFKETEVIYTKIID